MARTANPHRLLRRVLLGCRPSNRRDTGVFEMTHAELTPDEIACINCDVQGDCNPYHKLCGNSIARKIAERQSYAGRKVAEGTRGVKSAGVKRAMKEAVWRGILDEPPAAKMQGRAIVALKEMG